MLHIYYGNGKGKTSAAIGLAIRAAGQGLKVLFVQFLKSEDTGERYLLSEISNIDLTPCPLDISFTYNMTDSEKVQTAKIFRSIFDNAVKSALTENYDVLIFDEIFSAIEANMIKESDLTAFLANAPKRLEIILTGHNPSEHVLSLGDYVSEIKKIKHPYDKGLSARKGIEF